MKIPKEEFNIKQCSLNAINDICDLQETAFKYIENKDILRRNTKEMLLSCLQEPHYTVGAYYEDTLAGFAILYVGGESSENIGLDMDMTKEELIRTANIKLIIVHPDYRGNSLQQILVSELEKEAKIRGFKTLCATVSPDNIFSKRNFEKMGYILHSCKVKYGGLKRNIYYKNI